MNDWSDGTRRIVSLMCTLALILVFILILIGLTALAFGIDGLRIVMVGMWIVLGLAILVGFVWLLMRMIGANNANIIASFVDAQVSNDTSDVAKFEAITHTVKGMIKAEARSPRPQLTTSTAPVGEVTDDWYQLPGTGDQVIKIEDNLHVPYNKRYPEG